MKRSPEPTAAGALLLATKCYVPRWHAGLVSRPRLVARLDQGTGRKLALVSAPAGFGKTTLVTEWLASSPARERSAAWVSLDRGDNDPARFWSYVIVALQTQRPHIGVHARSLLQAPQPPPIESVVTALINDLSGVDDDITLVLDDLHVIDAPSIHTAIAFLLDHLPPRLRLMVTTREDPQLPLSRLRAQGQLTELRAADLRFTPDEAAAYFNEMMDFGLQTSEVAALETRTEGWIAGLQLAALSMQGHQDIPDFIRTFAGDHRYVVDYLVEEVLQQQPETIRNFLLQTSILDRLSASLCDAVTGHHEGSARLESLERGNFFVVPLDDKRQWFRYHHLFADVLQARLLAEQPQQVAALHGRASAWYEQQGSMAEAIRHALAAGDTDHAADLVELTATSMRRGRQEVTLLGWLRALPDEVVCRRPVLSAVYAGVLLSNGTDEGFERRLRDAERWLETIAAANVPSVSSLAGMVVVDDDEFRRLPWAIAVYRAGHALSRSDLDATVLHARRALELVPEDDGLYRGAAAAILGLASWTNGDLENAHASYAEGMASLQRAGYISDAIGGVLALADMRIAQGRLRDAMRAYEGALQLANEHGGPGMRGTADMYVGMADLHRERGDLDAAMQHLQISKDLGEHLGFPQNPYRWRVAMARIRAAQGDLSGALDLLHEAQQRYVSDMFPNVRPVSALIARLWIAQGRLDDAFDWARAEGLSDEDESRYMREYAHLTLARLLVAHHRSERVERSLHRATGLLERLLASADKGGRTGSAIEILILQAMALAARGNTAKALEPLERAMNLAEPEGYVRMFVGEGELMRDLLRQAAAQGIASSYAQRLLHSFGEPPTRHLIVLSQGEPTSLAEPLTAREIEILRLIAAGLRNQEIADQLFISAATVKRHIANAYGKLGVDHRTEAVARANALNIL